MEAYRIDRFGSVDGIVLRSSQDQIRVPGGFVHKIPFCTKLGNPAHKINDFGQSSS